MQQAYVDLSIPRAGANEGQLATKYAYLVKRAAAHLKSQVGGGVDLEDLEQSGMMGLIQAIRSYRGDLDDGFENFAFVRVRGAMRDEIRKMDMRSRLDRESANNLSAIRMKLYRALHREPTDQELAKASGLTLEKVRTFTVYAQAHEINQLEDWMTDGISGSEGLADKKILLTQALKKMNDRQRLIISLYYYYGMNMEEIAETVGLTSARVCQLHKECLALLNKLLKD